MYIKKDKKAKNEFNEVNLNILKRIKKEGIDKIR
jgi:hypothetical protein